LKAFPLAVILSLIFFGALSAAGRTGDITPPVLASAAAPSLHIDTAAAPETITFTLHITDDLSGVQSVQVDFRHEHGYNATRLCFVTVEPSVDAMIECPVQFPRYSAEGRWLVVWYGLTDAVGNQRGERTAECVGAWEGERCTQYAYVQDVPEVVRRMEV
jgi:hypothetical protein